jgi:hypothetical protein
VNPHTLDPSTYETLIAVLTIALVAAVGVGLYLTIRDGDRDL